MTPVDDCVHLVKMACPEVHIEVDEPKDPTNGVWFVDFRLNGKHVTLEWWKRVGFSAELIKDFEWTTCPKGPYFTEAAQAAFRVIELFGETLSEVPRKPAAQALQLNENTVRIIRGTYTLVLSPRNKREWFWRLYKGQEEIGHGYKETKSRAKRAGFKRVEKDKYAA